MCSQLTGLRGASHLSFFFLPIFGAAELMFSTVVENAKVCVLNSLAKCTKFIHDSMECPNNAQFVHSIDEFCVLHLPANLC